MSNLAMIAALTRERDGKHRPGMEDGRDMRYRGRPYDGGAGMAYDYMPMEDRRYPGRMGGEMRGNDPMGHWPYIPPVSRPMPRYDGEEMEDDDMEMRGNIVPIDDYRRIGFGEARRGQPRWQNGRFRRRGMEMEEDGPTDHYGQDTDRQQVQFGGMVHMTQPETYHQQAGGMRLTRGMADEWVESMESDSESHPKGGAFSWDMAKEWAQKVGVSTGGQKMIDFYAAINAISSDYGHVLDGYKMGTPEVYAKMAKAWIEDPDAVKNKAYMYYKCIVAK